MIEYKEFFSKYKKPARLFLEAATNIIPKLPTSEDNTFGVVVKSIGIIDTAIGYLKPKKPTKMISFLNTLIKEVEIMKNKQFVDMFFSTNLCDNFNIETVSVNDYMEIVVAESKDPTIGSLFFTQYSWSATPEYSAQFWYSSGFDFEKMLSELWVEYNKGIHIEMGKDSKNETKILYSHIHMKGDLFGSVEDRLISFSEKQKKYTDDKISRVYLFVGKPGTGKSIFALTFGMSLKKNIVSVNANNIVGSTISDIVFLIKTLKPSFLLIDDIDRAGDLEKCMSTLLTMISDMKEQFPELIVVLTVNDVTKLGDAFTRPGRIDEILEFDLPNDSDRFLILLKYADSFDLKIDDEKLSKIVEKTKDLSPAYLKEIMLQARYCDFDCLLGTIDQRKRILLKMDIKTTDLKPDMAV